MHRESTHNGVHLHWNSFARRMWKLGMLWIILLRIYKICLTLELLQNELQHIEK